MTIDAVRKQTTVMSADVVGYAAMMAANATATLAALLAHFRQIDALVRRFGGRIVDAPGDNLLAEFPDEASALLCAVEVQRNLGGVPRAAVAPRMHFRIGLHSGAILERKGRLYGDAVNIAARLQAAAEPDSILLSGAVAERAATSYRAIEELGSRRFKNIPYPVATYRAVI